MTVAGRRGPRFERPGAEPAKEGEVFLAAVGRRLIGAIRLRSLATVIGLLLLAMPFDANAEQPPQPIPDPAAFSQPRAAGWLDAPVPAYPDTAPDPSGDGERLRTAARGPVRLLFPWYDSISLRTWIHIANPGTAARTVTLFLNRIQVAQVSVDPGRNRYLVLEGQSAGPLLLEADGPVVASERTGSGASFSDFAALDVSTAGTELAFNWYDSRSIRTWLLAANPGSSPAQVSFRVGGAQVWAGTVAPGTVQAQLVPGISDGPAILSSDQPVLASLRAVLGRSFYETAGRRPSELPNESWYAWYDSISGLNDLHLANLGPAATDAVVWLDHSKVWAGSLGPHQRTVISLDRQLGGPLRIQSTQPLLGALRGVRRSRSPAFSEYPMNSAATAATSQWMPWYDYASPGAYEDVHLVAPLADAHATISIGGRTLWAGTVAAGGDRHIALPGVSGGPVYVASDQPVMTWQRAVYEPSPSAPVPPPARGYNIVLTVDDCGPAGQMHDIVQAIADKHIPAIFFPTGACRDANPWLVPEIQAHGYRACNHTYSHKPLTNLGYNGAWSEIARGVHAGCNLLRPPYGAWDGPHGWVAQVAAAQGYRIFLWDVDTGDSLGTSADFMLAKIRTHNGVVLMHFQGAHTLEAIRAL